MMQAASLDETINDFFQPITNVVSSIVFVSFQFTIADTPIAVPIVLVILIGSALYFTIHFKFVNFRKFGLAIDIVRGKYSDPNESGEVSHFQALTAALSGTVGLGNIAGVAVAVSLGGPGATFWMILAGLIGMSSKFVECTLGVKYREVDADGTVYGGPMYYLSKGFAAMRMDIGGKAHHFTKMGKTLAAIFAIAAIGGSFGGGNMFQVNQAYKQINDISAKPITNENVGELIGEKVFPKAGSSEYWVMTGLANGTAQLSQENKQTMETTTKTVATSELTSGYTYKPLENYGWLVGLIFAGIVGVVIIGGIKSIAKVTDKIVPFMCGIYVLAALVVLIAHASSIPAAFGSIFSSAFGYEAVGGGMVGVLLVGFKRAAFSNEAGIGSASIAHSAVKTNNPASEGLVALLEPFIDTVIVCTMTALVIVVTGVYNDPNAADGVALTSNAFSTVISWFPYLLVVAVILFAFSTMISWSYYGAQAWAYMFGRSKAADYTYKALFCLMVVVGAASQLGAVIDFSDAMIFLMLFPNMIGLMFLTPVVYDELNSYLGKIKTGEIKTVK